MGNDPLEFSALKECIQPYLASDLGLRFLEALSPYDTWDEARRRLSALSEMMKLIASGKEPAFPSIPDVTALLEVHQGALLEGQDIVRVAQSIRDSARIRYELENAGGMLAQIAGGIVPLESLATRIGRALLPTGEVSERANPVLKDLRARYRALRSSILEKLEEIVERLKTKAVLMDELITKRNDRFVIPLRHDYGTHLKGITHDYSRTNRTVYVEPLAVVNENNTLNILKSDIIEEEHKVLRTLTTLIHDHAREIRTNLEIYGNLDLLQACARWALKIDATVPEISGDAISLKAARHPLLVHRLGKKTVPLDILMPPSKDCLIISGPNAGGKTVALKTLGVIVLMAKSGLAIPACEDSSLPEIGHVWVEMDTNQDITHDLSSFTAHALSLKEIYESVRGGDLVLLDEPGTGTDPDHGGALAVSCIHALRNKGARVVATSHSDLVKLYGVSSDKVEIAATAFDDTGLKPLFSLVYGVIGTSRAFEILEAIAFPRPLIEEAQGIVGRHGNSTLAQAMEDISEASRMRREAQQALLEASSLREKARESYQEREQERISAALKYKRLMNQVQVLTTKPSSAEAIGAVEQSHEAIELTEILETSEIAQSLKVGLGCRVIFKGSEMEGEVVELRDQSAEVLFGTKRMKVGLEQLQVLDRKGSQDRKKTLRIMAAPAPVLPIVVVGLRIDEALPVVEQAIDRAILSGQDSLEIVHGAGTGRLKKAIRDYLKDLKVVTTFHDGPVAAGGGNVTVVRLSTNP
ncbi:MAG: Smr/MutS family protein [Desulfomonilia bacterium]|nr:Smr/MutS family protein [Desulfomonilia bacterium]